MAGKDPNSPQKYLRKFLDVGLPTIPNYDVAAKQQRQVERLLREFALFSLTEAHPRRLGKSATPEELALDAKLARSCIYVAASSLKAYGLGAGHIRKQSAKYFEDPNVKSESAQVDFEEYIYTKIAYLRHEMREIATNAIDTPQEPLAKKLVSRIDRELLFSANRYEKLTNTQIILEKIPENI